ncbi:2-dehydropantoate 2-reductase [Xylariales sp. PMI_506]|nr:2-dehydropantoate 2-reductase [Xylariales sp. PMI_506]
MRRLMVHCSHIAQQQAHRRPQIFFGTAGTVRRFLTTNLGMESSLSPYLSPTLSHDRIYVLGVGNIGKYIAYYLAKQSPRLPITLLLHRPNLVNEWRSEGQGITRVLQDIPDIKTGFEVELLPNPPDGLHELNHQDTHRPIKHLIVTTKTYATASALGAVQHRLHASSTVLLLQNGMGTVDEVSETLFRDSDTRPQFWAGICSAGIYSLSPFKFVHAGHGTLELGPIYNPPTASIARPVSSATSDNLMVRTILETTTLKPRLLSSDEIKEAQLRKLVINAMINPLTALFRCKNGELFCIQDRLDLMRLLLEEASTIVQALSPTPPHHIEDNLSQDKLMDLVLMVADKTGENTSSMLQDVQSGRKTEIDYINGYLVAQAKRLNLPYKKNETIVKMIKDGEIIRDDDIQKHF